MTERLYYHDSTLLEFDATVVEFVGDRQHVVLDRTAFYPASGGQPHDLGTLGAARVVGVTDDGDRIVHVLDAALAPGPVRGAVDAIRRRDHMQQHTAQHLLSAIAADRYGWQTVSVHFGAEHSTIEFTAAIVPPAQLAELEQLANAAVAEARPVTVAFEDAASAEHAGLRKPSDRRGEIRVITIERIDRSACGGTHVSRTSEIGPVLLLDGEKIRGHVRIGFVAGGRVLSHARASDATLAGLARELGCSARELGALVPARLLEYRVLSEQTAKLEHTLAAVRLGAMRDTTAPGPDGVRRMLYRAVGESGSLLRCMVNATAPLERTMLVVLSANPPTIHVATSIDSGLNAGSLLKPALGAIGGRGGGSDRAAQGTAPTVAALEQVAGRLMAGS